MVTGFKTVLLQELVLELGKRPTFPKKKGDFKRGYGHFTLNNSQAQILRCRPKKLSNPGFLAVHLKM